MAKRFGVKMLLAALAVTASLGAAHANNVVVNGGFETGNLNGWTTNNVGSATGSCPNADRNWNVATSSNTGCNAVAGPVGGGYAAYVMGDGAGPVDYILQQTIADPRGLTNGMLSFQWESSNAYDSGRMFNVSIDGVDVFSQSTYGNFGWTNESINVTSILQAHAGQQITLAFDNYIPHTWTGPGGLGLDNVALNVTATGVPEPGSVALFGIALAGLALMRRKMTQRG